MAFFKESFLNARRAELLRSVCRFQYQLNGGTWKNGEINSKQILGTSVVVFVNVPSSGSADNMTTTTTWPENRPSACKEAVSTPHCFASHSR